MYRCDNCGSTKVESKTWVGVNTGKLGEHAGGDTDEEDNWCPDCETHCSITEDSGIKEFLCIQLSENRNSFGLRQMILIARDGTAVKACANDLNVLEEYKTVMSTGNLQFANFELVEETESAPQEVVDKLWIHKDK